MRFCTSLEGLQNRIIKFALNASLKLFSHFLYDSQLTAIVTAGGAYGVEDVPSATVGAYGEGRSYSLVMSTTLEGASLRLSSFRMCHGVLFVFLIDDLVVCLESCASLL